MSDDDSLEALFNELTPEHRANLGYILKLEDSAASTDQLLEGVRWCFHSRARQHLRTSQHRVSQSVQRLFDRDTPAKTLAPPSVPSYRELLNGLARKMDIDCDGVPLEVLEKHLIYTIISECLHRMTPEQRVGFFEQNINHETILGDGIVDSGVSGPLQTMTVLSLANLWGSGLFAASATALGLVTNAVGLTLPFAISAGISSTIAFVIGPAGWLGAATWLAWRMTGPEWKTLTQVVVYLITQRHRPRATELAIQS